MLRLRAEGNPALIDLLQKSLTPHPQPLPLVRGGEHLRQQMRGGVLSF